MSGNWIADALNPANKGVFKKKASAAGMSTGAYAASVTKKGSKASTATKRRANLAKTLASFHKGGKK